MVCKDGNRGRIRHAGRLKVKKGWTFLWHNRYDKFVPAINPVMIAAKMLELDLPFELHIFQGGEHGMSVCNSLSPYNEEGRRLNEENPNVRMWVPMCINWINGLFHI